MQLVSLINIPLEEYCRIFFAVYSLLDTAIIPERCQTAYSDGTVIYGRFILPPNLVNLFEKTSVPNSVIQCNPGVLLGILGGGVSPGSPNHDPISDQKM